jgi:type III secretion protein L
MELFRITKEMQVLTDRKIIKEEDYSTLESSADVLKKAKAWLTKFKKDAKAELESAKSVAIEEGKKEGSAAFTEHMLKLDDEWKKLEEKITKNVLSIAISASQKIIGKQLALDPNTIVSIVKEALRSVAHFRRIKVYVHPDDVEYLETSKPELKTLFEHLESLSIVPNPEVDKGGCRIEYEGGVLNAELPIVLDNLTRILAERFAKGGPNE